jgi:hypothetical protein
MEVLRLEQLLRPLRRQLPQLEDRADEIQVKLKVGSATNVYCLSSEHYIQSIVVRVSTRWRSLLRSLRI